MRDLQPQSCRSLAVDDKSKLRRLLNGKIARLFASQDPSHIGGHFPKRSMRQPRRTHHRSDIDWCAVESDCRTGLLSLREFAQKHRCSHSAIANFADRNARQYATRATPRRIDRLLGFVLLPRSALEPRVQGLAAVVDQEPPAIGSGKGRLKEARARGQGGL